MKKVTKKNIEVGQTYYKKLHWSLWDKFMDGCQITKMLLKNIEN